MQRHYQLKANQPTKRRRWSAYTVVCLLVLLCIGIVFLDRVAKGRMLAVQSASMQPLFERGDLLWAEPVRGTYHVGEVVSYRSRLDSRQTVSHRVISVDPYTQTLITKGDNLSHADPPIRTWDVLGRVRYVIPDGGYILTFLASWPGLILAVYLPATILLGSEAWRLCTSISVQSYCAAHYIHRKVKLVH